MPKKGLEKFQWEDGMNWDFNKNLHLSIKEGKSPLGGKKRTHQKHREKIIFYYQGGGKIRTWDGKP